MPEKPILFSTEMVKAILDGRKTQTRRVIKPQPVTKPWVFDNRLNYEEPDGKVIKIKLPYQPGDVLWIRETWNGIRFGNGGKVPYRTEYWYKADDNSDNPDNKWRSSACMPRAAARIFLRVTDVRMERVQEISDKDAIAEGFKGKACNCPNARVWGYGANGCEDCYNTGWLEPPTVSFMQTWDSLNAKRGFSWESNPWVEAVCFELIAEKDLS